MLSSSCCCRYGSSCLPLWLKCSRSSLLAVAACHRGNPWSIFFSAVLRSCQTTEHARTRRQGVQVRIRLSDRRCRRKHSKGCIFCPLAPHKTRIDSSNRLKPASFNSKTCRVGRMHFLTRSRLQLDGGFRTPGGLKASGGFVTSRCREVTPQ